MPTLGILVLVLVSCTTICPELENLNRIAYQTAKMIEKNLCLETESIGRTQLDEKATTIEITFLFFSSLTIETGRDLMLKCIQIANNNFQNNQQSLEVILDSEFDMNKLAIFLFSDLYAFDETPSELLSALSFYKGIIKYKRYNTQTRKLETILEETYEEALQKCQL